MIMSKRYPKILVGILILLTTFLASACSGEDTAPDDGDTDAVDSSSDGDSNVDGDTETIDPCAELQCSPGGECLKRKNNVPYCFCNSGYHANNDSTQCLLNETDGDAEVDKDIDWDYDTTACNPASTPWPNLPCCNTDGSGPRPCIIDLEFEYTNEIGEFTLGFRDARYLYSFDINGEMIIFVQNSETEPYKGGVKIFDYKSKTGVMVEDNSNKTKIRFSSISNTMAYYAKRDHYIVDTESMVISADYLYEVDLITMQNKMVEDTESERDLLDSTGEKVCWLDNRLSPEELSYHIYSFTIDGTTAERLDLLSEAPATEFDVYGDSMLYSIGYSAMVLKNFETGVETLLTDTPQEMYYPRISDKYATWYDLSTSISTYNGCGKSLVLYDREKEKVEYFKKSSGLDDHAALDLWEDWMLYYECHDGISGQEHCCDSNADGDIYIYHFPTQQSWKLTDSPGARHLAKMYDHLIVWADGRNNPDVRTQAFDFYGIDLCRHPELKDYFESCKSDKIGRAHV